MQVRGIVGTVAAQRTGDLDNLVAARLKGMVRDGKIQDGLPRLIDPLGRKRVAAVKRVRPFATSWVKREGAWISSPAVAYR